MIHKFHKLEFYFVRRLYFPVFKFICYELIVNCFLYHSAYGNLTVRSLLDTIEHLLREFDFPDPYILVTKIYIYIFLPDIVYIIYF